MKEPSTRPNPFDSNYEERREKFIPATASPNTNRPPTQHNEERHKGPAEQSLPQAPEQEQHQ